jgi:hypothetical protein
LKKISFGQVTSLKNSKQNLMECDTLATIRRLEALVEVQRQEVSRLLKEKQETNRVLHTLRKVNTQHMSMKRKYSVMRAAHTRLQLTHSKCSKVLRCSFPTLGPDQLHALTRKSTKGMKWSAKSIKDGLVLKMRCGTSGYSEFVSRYPLLPSVRALQSYVQFIQFESGMLQEMWDLTEAAAETMNDYERECCVVLDEIAIKPGERFDPSSQRWVGKCTLPSHSGTSKKALVIMLAGLTRRWKIVVAYYLTSQVAEEDKKKKNTTSETGKVMADILTEVLVRLEKVGLRACSITSDMGPDNLAWWRVFGIDAPRCGPVKCSIPNPGREGGVVYVLPDAPHLFKAIKKMLESNGSIMLPPAVVKENNLPSSVVEYKHIVDLYEYESNMELKIAFRLKESNIHCKAHFEKMNVSTARAVLNHRTGVALTKLAEVKKEPSYVTTAWFVMLLNTFFEVVTSRHRGIALSKSDLSSYEKALGVIRTVSFLFQHMKVGAKGVWKPAQRGVRLLCAGLLEIQNYYLNERSFSFLLLGHLTQDCIENLFSCIRLGQAVPNALSFIQNLKVITLAMYHTHVKGSSYDFEEGQYLVDPLSKARERAAERKILRTQKAKLEAAEHPVSEITDEDLQKITEWERNVIYDMAGSALHSLRIRSTTLCSACISALLWKNADKPHQYGVITRMKEYVTLKSDQKENQFSQIEVSDECFLAILALEVVFRKMRADTVHFENVNVVKYLVDSVMFMWDGSSVPQCHNICRKILESYLNARVKQYGMLRSSQIASKEKEVDYSSKSIAMRQTVEIVCSSKK